MVEHVKERFRHLLKERARLVSLLPNCIYIFAEEVGVAGGFGESITLSLVKVPEDGLTEFLQRRDNVPCLVVFYVVVDIVENPFHQLIVHAQ